MALMGCLGCDGTYEIGLPQCPHCGTRSPMYTTKETQMPTITSGGASNAAEAVETEDVAAEAVAEVEAAPIPADAETVTEVVPEAPAAAIEPEPAVEQSEAAVPAAVVEPAAEPEPEVAPEAPAFGGPTSMRGSRP